MTQINTLANLKDRVSIVTGGNGFLGTAICSMLAEQGSDIIVVDHPDYCLIEQIQRLQEEFSVKAYGFNIDLIDHNKRLEFLNDIKEQFSSIDILINNAAYVGSSQIDGWNCKFSHQSIEAWRDALELNLSAPFHLSQGLSELLKESKSGSIINIASIYGLYAPKWEIYEGTDMNNPAAYSASKGGLIQFSRWLSSTLAPNVRVNCISPGGIYRNQPDEFIKKYEKATPLNRMAYETDMLGAIAFLGSDMSKYVTGQNIVIDGGWGV